MLVAVVQYLNFGGGSGARYVEHSAVAATEDADQDAAKVDWSAVDITPDIKAYNTSTLKIDQGAKGVDGVIWT